MAANKNSNALHIDPAQAAGSQFEYDPSSPPSVLQVAKNLKLEEFKYANLSKMPCSSKSLIYATSAGVSIAGIRFLVTRSLKSAGNFGFLSFGLVAAASWEFCRFQRRVIQQQLDAMNQFNKQEALMESNSDN